MIFIAHCNLSGTIVKRKQNPIKPRKYIQPLYNINNSPEDHLFVVKVESTLYIHNLIKHKEKNKGAVQGSVQKGRNRSLFKKPVAKI